MPHVVIEYFSEAGIDREAVLLAALETAAQSGVMQRADIKVRLLPSEAILFGDGRRSFIHMTISMLTGRTPEAKLGLSQAMVAKMRQVCPTIEAISADIRDMDPEAYKKSLV
jgi:5-carboxymethyl-2-hydroxymuconate isomerase